jgi:excisionase family DNA binding protein
MTMTDGNTLTVDDAAKALRVTARTVRNYLVRKSRPLPHSKPGGRILINSEDLAEWLKIKRR